jgi:hypothetical protein
MSAELMHCPGCGSDELRVIGGPGTRGGPQHWAGCDHCRWRTWGNTEAEAIAAWNTRHDHSPDAGKMGEDAGGVIGYVGLITPSQRGAPDDVTIVVHTKIRYLEGLGDKLLSGPVMICAIDAARAGERG